MNIHEAGLFWHDCDRNICYVQVYQSYKVNPILGAKHFQRLGIQKFTVLVVWRENTFFWQRNP